MYALTLPETTSTVYTIFGIQHHTQDTPSPLSTQLTILLTPHLPSKNTTLLTHPGPDPLTTTIHLTSRPTKTFYEERWHSDPVTTFWNTLPDDAGIYRETITVAVERTQHSTNKPISPGMGCLGPYTPIPDKSGYWGCYYHRIPATAGATGPEGRFPSLVKETPKRKESTGAIRHGRVHMTQFPENICFAVEGQDHSNLTTVERETWFEKFDLPTLHWMNELQSAGPETGLLETRVCYDPQSGRFRDGEPDVLSYNRKVQLFYFLGMKCMERVGRRRRRRRRRSKEHVLLRREFLKSYGAGGELAEAGGALFVG
ncbi:hem-containing dehydratase protein [Aspergillus novoparasiticus]|uniref:Hem-containing dehydratase protein n=1 Tax=Aspergillus novoparasiticus TaxID=986946 RepID=A0A5N6EVQ6_9EURO|nr:hem-containing dehydratase protein [Aspergillus novoparasiticus]